MKKISVIDMVCSLIISSACTQSGRLKPKHTNGTTNVCATNRRKKRLTGKTVIKMEKSGNVYKIPVTVNSSKMNFIFDTGASDISISEVEALFLFKQGTLTKSDIMGNVKYQIANGSLSEGTIINLKKVQIGNKALENVKASVIHNVSAPFLLGQSALNQFGKITIDYNKNEITLE